MAYLPCPALWLVAAAAIAGCKTAPPPRPPPAAAAPAPPPKKCDALDEECVATKETRSPIQDSGWSIAPPPEWTYAHAKDATLARTKDAALAVTIHETGKKKEVAAKRQDAFGRLTERLGLTPPKKAPKWPYKAAKTESVGEVKVALYQFDGFTKQTQPGALLAFTSTLPGDRSLLGVGFVLMTDKHDADQAILECVKSLRTDAATDGKGAAPVK